MTKTKDCTVAWQLWSLISERDVGDDRGQSLIELALILPVLIAMLVVAAEIGRLVHGSIEVSNAAYSRASYGAQNLFTATDFPGMQRAALNDAVDLQTLGTGSIKATAKELCSCSNGYSITCANASNMCQSPARIKVYVEVDTTATIASLFSTARSHTVTGRAIVQVAQ